MLAKCQTDVQTHVVSILTRCRLSTKQLVKHVLLTTLLIMYQLSGQQLLPEHYRTVYHSYKPQMKFTLLLGVVTVLSPLPFSLNNSVGINRIS